MTTVDSGGFDNLIVISVFFFLIIKCGEDELKYLVTLTVF